MARRATALDLGARPKQALVRVFVVAAVLGLALSGFIAWTSKETMRSSTPLIREQMPLLEELGDIERRLLAIQTMNQQYFAYAINRETWQQQRTAMHADFARSLARLDAAFPDEEGLRVVRVVLENFAMLEPKLDAELQRAEIDWDEARAIIVEMAIDSGNIRRHLQSLRERMSAAVLAAGERTEASIARTTTLVAAYSALIFVISLLVASHIRARSRAEAELAFNAAHDPVTGCYNRRALAAIVDGLGGEAHGLVVVAVERFHRIIGSLGHEAADETLTALAQTFERLAAPLAGHVFRLDGAHFALLAPLARMSPEALAARVATIARQPFVVGKHDLLIGLSCGAARYPADAGDGLGLLRSANVAQAHAYAAGLPFVPFAAEFEARSAHRLELESALGHAVERGELELHYQPQMDIASGRIIGAEALVRWRRDGTLVSPAEFIPAAEDTGLIVGIGRWVLEEACRQAAAWWREGLGEPVVAVNVSARQFLDPCFFDCVRAALADSGVSPAAIELEVTESAIMHDPDAVIDMLRRLRDLGLKVAIDDFGTGYSSLAYLRRFPLDKLKVDQSFVRHLGAGAADEDAAIVAAVVRLGQTLGLKVIAEGVESEGQRDLLHALGCDEIQGYWLSRPLPADAAQAFLVAQRQPRMP